MKSIRNPKFSDQLIFYLIITLFLGKNLYSQETEYKKTSIKTGLGIGFNQGHREIGMGLIHSIGWQKSYGKKDKIRLNSNLAIGGFSPFITRDVRKQFYRISTLGLYINFDLIKYKSISIIAAGGTFINYSRGLIGTGGPPDENYSNNSEYFYSLYFGGNASIGLRVDIKKNRLSYEFRPINISIGNRGFMLAYLLLEIDFKLKKRTQQ